MVAVTVHHDVGWLTPCPMWKSLGDLRETVARERFVRPAILRFADDSFMDELMDVLAYEPARLPEWRAQYETWEQPMRTPVRGERPALPEPTSALSTRLFREARRRQASAATRTVDSAADSAGGDDEPARALKLYQPVHKRFYLVSASLVCRQPGLPNRHINRGRQEQVGFVMRRVESPLEPSGQPSDDPAQWKESAFVPTQAGGQWQPVATSSPQGANRVLPGEERLPMFGTSFADTGGQRRQLFHGLIPVGRREAYLAAGTSASTTAEGADGADEAERLDPRVMLFQLQVTGPWHQLVFQALDDGERSTMAPEGRLSQIELDYENDGGVPGELIEPNVARDAIQTASWYILLDFARFLRRHLQPIWRALTDADERAALDPVREGPLMLRLQQTVLEPTLAAELTAGSTYPAGAVQPTLLDALQRIAESENADGEIEVETLLEEVVDPLDRTQAGDWPRFLFPLADPRASGPFPFRVAGVDFSGHASGRIATLQAVTAALEELDLLIEDALPPVETSPPAPELALPAASSASSSSTWYAIRCVYERPNCRGRVPTVVSEPTRLFEMASFFDPEAPARPARIPMPLDISPAGLRKFSKGTTLMISDMLCGQLKRIRKFSLGDLVLSVLPWPFHKDLPNPVASPGDCQTSSGASFGMFCSLSIPIVTLCALILLIVMVQLFDLFFRWVPFLFVCLPIPGLKGKKK